MRREYDKVKEKPFCKGSVERDDDAAVESVATAAAAQDDGGGSSRTLRSTRTTTATTTARVVAQSWSVMFVVVGSKENAPCKIVDAQ